jgi:hypothetical protein
MAKLPKGFISLGNTSSWLSIKCVDQDKSYYDPRIDKVAVIDIYGNRFNVERKLVENKINYKK